jgi:hypothetical protein
LVLASIGDVIGTVLFGVPVLFDMGFGFVLFDFEAIYNDEVSILKREYPSMEVV